MAHALRIEAVAFDLDGTLLDSAPDIADALDAALRRENLRGFDLATVRRWIGDGPDALIARALAAHGDPTGAAPLQRRLRATFDEVTLATPLRHGRVYDGIGTLLARLSGTVPMAVVTNKPTRLARAVLAAAGLIGRFASVHGADSAAQRKPARTLLDAAAAALGVEPRGLLMVGDGPPDALAARAAGCPMAWVGWGYGAWHGPAAPDRRRVATPDELLGLILSAGTRRTNR